MTPLNVSVERDEVGVLAGWVSNRYTGDSRFVFVLDGEKIKEMRIASA